MRATLSPTQPLWPQSNRAVPKPRVIGSVEERKRGHALVTLLLAREAAAGHAPRFPRAMMSRGMRPGPRRAAKRDTMRLVTNRLLNPVVRRLLERGLWPQTQALLETTGRKTGSPRRVPVGNGLRGDSFWIVTEHGYAADYVKNIHKQPRVRVKLGRRWYEGTAQTTPSCCSSAPSRSPCERRAGQRRERVGGIGREPRARPRPRRPPPCLAGLR